VYGASLTGSFRHLFAFCYFCIWGVFNRLLSPPFFFSLFFFAGGDALTFRRPEPLLNKMSKYWQRHKDIFLAD
jgi:hypothetical protein